MSFVPVEVIRKKRDGQKLSKEELKLFIDGFLEKKIPDYQISSLLMAIYLKGMTSEEAAELTDVMLHSGRVLDFSNLAEAKVDKHSTGGVGDKTSLILAPLVMAAGIRVPMMAGRGLGHTGGTLDKLESIPGFSTQVPLDQFDSLIKNVGGAIIGQTSEICPADRKLYALRDVTGTIESIPLICASIMSKKIAEGIDALVLDVKFGSGAFMKTVEQARNLAQSLMNIGVHHGKKVSALLTSMEQPLGRFIGNANEVQECIAIMKQEGFDSCSIDDFSDTQELTLELAGAMIWRGGKASSAKEGYDIAKKLLLDGKAFEKFEEMCAAQGGDLKKLPTTAPCKKEIKAQQSGFLKSLDTEQIGMAALLLGAGRKTQEDTIDPVAGLKIHFKIGDAVQSGDTLFTLSASDEKLFLQAEQRITKALSFSDTAVTAPTLIQERLDSN